MNATTATPSAARCETCHATGYVNACGCANPNCDQCDRGDQTPCTDCISGWRYAPLRPALPEVGDTVQVFGVQGVVTAVEPASDWAWGVTLVSTDAGAQDITWVVQVPTDFDTVTGGPAYPLPAPRIDV